MRERLRFVVRTPHETVFDAPARAVRVPAESGLVGSRPREEPFVVAVEPGLILVRADGGAAFVASAGGLLHADRETAALFTPFAVVGADDDEVLAALDRALATPGSELAARRRLGELERSIVAELRRRPGAARRAGRSAGG